MPNLPVGIGKGVVGLHSDDADAGVREAVTTLMAPLGLVEWMSDESLFDVVTALAGSGPGFLYRVIDALAAGGAALGLPADQAQRMAIATVEGSAMLASAADVSPAVLADRVASPGGSTREGLNVLDRDDALKVLMRRPWRGSDAAQSREMAAAARRVGLNRSASLEFNADLPPDPPNHDAVPEARGLPPTCWTSPDVAGAVSPPRSRHEFGLRVTIPDVTSAPSFNTPAAGRDRHEPCRGGHARPGISEAASTVAVVRRLSTGRFFMGTL